MILIGAALLVFSVALIVTPSGAVPATGAPLPVGAGDASVCEMIIGDIPSGGLLGSYASREEVRNDVP